MYAIRSYYDKYEVTNTQYKKCVAAGGCTIPSLIIDYPPALHEEGKDWYQDSAKDDFPVVGLTWKQAGEYCRWAGKRLPRAAEWEKAARGADGWIFPWGNTWDGTKANCRITSYNVCYTKLLRHCRFRSSLQNSSSPLHVSTLFRDRGCCKSCSMACAVHYL